MSGPLKLNPPDLRALAEFLEGLSQLGHTTGWQLSYGASVELTQETGSATVRIEWSDTAGSYMVDDRVGD